MERSFYDRYAQLEDTHWWFAGRRAIVARAVEVHRPHQGRPLRILEVGCGTGGVLTVLKEYGTAVGLDVSHEALMQARHRGLPRLVRGDSYVLPFSDRSFDIIGMFDTLEHVEDDRAALREVYRVCRPGGRVILSVPALPLLWGRQDVVSHHYRRYMRSEIVDRVQAAGFEATYATYFNTWLFPAIAAIRVGRRIVGDRGGPERSDFDATPPRVINALLARMMASEARVVGRFALPIGVSILSVGMRALSDPYGAGRGSVQGG